MQKVRLTKQFDFEMAHALWNYDGPCKHIHGHSYELKVTVIGNILNDLNHPKHGMVMDFGVLKDIVKESIIDKLDHALVLNAHAPYQGVKAKEELFDQVVLVPYQPTCENMIVDFAQRISNLLPENIRLHSLFLRETANSYAEWFADDQKK